MNPFTTPREIAQSAKDTSETDDIDSNHLDNSDDGLEQDQVNGGVPDDPILDYLRRNKDNAIKRDIILYLLYAFQFDPHAVRSFLISLKYLRVFLVQWKRIQSCSYLWHFGCISLQNNSRIDFFIPNNLDTLITCHITYCYLLNIQFSR